MGRHKDTILFIVLLLGLLVLIYRQAIFGGKIIFPSNFLAHFFPPYSTQTYPGWEQGIPNKPVGTDEIRFFYPGRNFSNRGLARGELPFWDPYIFAGSPHLANFQSAIFYPLNALYLLLPQLTAWSILVIIQPFLGTIFTYLYLRALPIKKTAAMIGAFTFGFSGFLIVWSQENAVVGQAAIWLPLVLLGLERFAQKQKWSYLFITTFALTASLLAGYLQTTFYIAALAFVYGLVRIRKIVPVVLALALAGPLSAVELLPSYEAFTFSPRPTAPIEEVFRTYLLPFSHLIHTLAPDINGNLASYNYFGRGSYNETMLYIGTVAMISVVLAIIKSRDRVVRFFLGSAAISFLLTSDFPLTSLLLHLPLPLIPTFVPSRILVVTTFSFSVLTAYGISFWLEKREETLPVFRKIALILVAILLAAGLYYLGALVLRYLRLVVLPTEPVKPLFDWRRANELVAMKNLVIPIGLLSLAAAFRRSLVVIAVLIVFGQFYFFNKYLVLGEREFLYPKNPVMAYLAAKKSDYFRFQAFGVPIKSNFSIMENVYSLEGFDPIFSKRYGQLVAAAKNGGRLTDDLPRIEVALFQLGRDDSLADNFRRLRLIALLGTKYILYFDDGSDTKSVGEIFPPDLFLPDETLGKWQAFTYRNVLPRTYLVKETVVETDPQKILDKLFDENLDLSKTAVLEEPVKLPAANTADKNDKAEIVSYAPSTVEIRTASCCQRLLFLSDNYFPGWKALVDGSPTKIYRADFAFRSVLVPPGNHVVRFVYDPFSLKLGATISAMALLGLVVILGLVLGRKL